MVLLDPSAQARVLDLGEVADLGIAADVAAGSEVGVGTDERAVLDGRLLDDAPPDGHLSTDRRVDDRRLRPDQAALADRGCALQEDAWIERDVLPDRDAPVDVDRRWVAHRDAGPHVGLVDPDPKGPLGLGELVAVVDAVERAVVLEPDRAHDPAVLACERHEIGEVQLAVRLRWA